MKRFLLTAALLAPIPALAQEPAGSEQLRTLDLGSDGRQFDQWFQRFGHKHGKTVVPERNGARFQLPALKGEEMIGYSSAFSLAGNFEVCADLVIITLPKPTAGYGPAIGLTLDAEQSDGSVGLTRGLSAEGNPQFVVTRVTPGSAETGPKVETEVYPASGNRAKLVLRREKAQIVCLATDQPGGEPRELKRLPFTERRVRHLRFHAANGGSPTPVTGRLTGVRIQADEIVGGITPTELADVRSYWWWWMPVAGAAFFGAFAVWVYRRRGAPGT